MSDTIRTCLAEGEALLVRAGVASPRLDAVYLLSEALGQDRAHLAAFPERECPAPAVEAYRVALHRRARREPVQYVLGKCHFWRDVFLVNPDVLIPRPETELLVEIGVEALRGKAAPRILDLAAGSGCVGLSLLRELPQARVTATDRSSAALRTAAANARQLGLADRWEVVAGDGLSHFLPTARWDYIAANPPYVDQAAWAELAPEIRGWEPRSALTDEGDGLDFYRRWIPPSAARLAPGGLLAMEFGFGQWSEIRKALSALGGNVSCRQDLGGIPRAFAWRSDLWP